MGNAFRIGFCCKKIDYAHQVNGIKPNDECKKYNLSTTTVSWLKRQNKLVADDKLWEILQKNLKAVNELVNYVGKLDKSLRFVRLGSDICPVYTHTDFQWFWSRTDVKNFLEKNLAVVGDYSRNNDIRLSFHPGQFCALSSDNEDIVISSIDEIEYHADLARYMGYGQSFHDCGFKINVHISGKYGVKGIIDALTVMSVEARNLITIENDENTYGLEDCLLLKDYCPIVLDVHHHWCKENEYISPFDDKVKNVIDSWRGIRPVLHYSISSENLLSNEPNDILLDRNLLLSRSNINKQKLRAHSNYYWNNAVNDYVLQFLNNFDIQCEAKAKNLASMKLYEYYCNN